MFRKRLNQGNLFHRGNGSESFKSHPKGSGSSFEKFPKREDSKEVKDEAGFPKNAAPAAPERLKDDKPREHTAPGHPNAAVEEMTRLLLKFHSNRFKDFKRQMNSAEAPEPEPKTAPPVEPAVESHEPPHKSYRPSYGYRSSYSRERGHDRHKYKS